MSILDVDILQADDGTSIEPRFPVNGVSLCWYNLDGSGTIAGREDFNVSSFDDSGTGLYDANFTNSTANDLWAYGQGSNFSGGTDGDVHTEVARANFSTSEVNSVTRDIDSNSLADADTVCIEVAGSLA